MGKADFSETVDVMSLMIEREARRREELTEKAPELVKERKRQRDSEARRAASNTAHQLKRVEQN